MDPNDLLPYVLASLLTGGGVYKLVDAWVTARRGGRSDNLAEFKAITDGLRTDLDRQVAENERERERREEAEAKAEAASRELAEYRGRTDARIEQMQRAIDGMILERCPWGRVDCPRERVETRVEVGSKE